MKKGFAIGVYTEADKLQADGVERIFGLAQLAAWLGRTQFAELLKTEVPGGYKNGRININLYLANALVKILLSELMSAHEAAA